MREFIDDDGHTVGIEQVEVMCGQCTPCKARLRHNVAGRIGGEALGFAEKYFVTLTIGGDLRYGGVANNPRANDFHPKDVSDYLKRLRAYTERDALKLHLESGRVRADFVKPKIRYYRVGEVGTLKGRVHYHLVLFIEHATRPEGVPLWKNFFHGKMDESVGHMEISMPKVGCDGDRTYWPWGFSNWEEFNGSHALYVAKYATKPAEDSEAESGYRIMRPSRSTRPMLAANWYADYGRRCADQALAIRDRKYQIAAAEPGRKPTTYMLPKAAVVIVGRAYETRWYERAKLGEVSPHPPMTDFLDAFHRIENKRLLEAPEKEIEQERLRSVRVRIRKLALPTKRNASPLAVLRETLPNLNTMPRRIVGIREQVRKDLLAELAAYELPASSAARRIFEPVKFLNVAADKGTNHLNQLLARYGERNEVGEVVGLPYGPIDAQGADDPRQAVVADLARVDEVAQEMWLEAYIEANEGPFPSWSDAARRLLEWGHSVREVLERVTLSAKMARKGGKLAGPEFWFVQGPAEALSTIRRIVLTAEQRAKIARRTEARLAELRQREVAKQKGD